MRAQVISRTRPLRRIEPFKAIFKLILLPLLPSQPMRGGDKLCLSFTALNTWICLATQRKSLWGQFSPVEFNTEIDSQFTHRPGLSVKPSMKLPRQWKHVFMCCQVPTLQSPVARGQRLELHIQLDHVTSPWLLATSRRRGLASRGLGLGRYFGRSRIISKLSLMK